MINPPETDTKHSTMQLNMGEGKTAVIVPILASVLANGTQACQITVLRSLFSTNLKSLRRYLGGMFHYTHHMCTCVLIPITSFFSIGMLGRRVYTFPCRRDMPISQHISEICNIYETCKKVKGSNQYKHNNFLQSH